MVNMEINTKFITLSQMMKMANVVQSGGEAKQIILDGLVTVNKEVCIQRGKKLFKGDIIEFDNQQYVIN